MKSYKKTAMSIVMLICLIPLLTGCASTIHRDLEKNHANTKEQQFVSTPTAIGLGTGAVIGIAGALALFAYVLPYAFI